MATQSLIPKLVKLSGVDQITCNHHTAAITESGALYFWGTGVFGMFWQPKLIIDSEIATVSVGGSFGIAKDKNGILWAWGQNDLGQLGSPDCSTQPYPKPIACLKKKTIKSIACGGSFAVVLGNEEHPKKRDRSERSRSEPKLRFETADAKGMNKENREPKGVLKPSQSQRQINILLPSAKHQKSSKVTLSARTPKSESTTASEQIYRE